MNKTLIIIISLVSFIIISATSLLAFLDRDHKELTDDEKLLEAAEIIEIEYVYSSQILLPSKGLHGATIKWHSDDIEIIDNTIDNPLKTEGDKLITLTATYKLNESTFVKTYTTTILANNFYTFDENLSMAIEQEDHKYLTLNQLSSELSSYTISHNEYSKNLLNRIYPNGIETYENEDYLMWSSFIYADLNSVPVIQNENQVFGLINSIESSKYFVSGIQVFNEISGMDIYTNTDLQMNIISELVGTQNPSLDNLIVLTFDDDFETYLNDNNVVNNFVITDDESLLDTGDYDIFIGNQPIKHQLEKVVSKDKPFMAFYHRWYMNSDGIEFLKIDLSFPGAYSVNNFNSIDEMISYSPNSLLNSSTNIILDETLDLHIDINEMCSTSGGKTTCDFTQADYLDSNFYKSFILGVETTKDIIQIYDYYNLNIFETENYELIHSLLIADKLRDDIIYPMSFDEDTIYLDFFRALYSDSLINYSRTHMELQNDLGWFSPNEDQVQLLENSTQSITIEQNNDVEEIYTTGLYVKAGNTITISRSDNSYTIVHVTLNFERDGNSRIYDGVDSYHRPYEITSNEMRIESNQTITISTPHGGGIYIYLTDKDYNNNIQLEISNVVPYPVLRSIDQNSINEFITSINETPINWVDMITDYAHIHSVKQRMISSLNSYQIGNESEYFYDINRYLIQENYKLAGFTDDTLLPLNQSVIDYCDLYDLDCLNSSIHLRPRIQHINVNFKSKCGALCSGNPFDTGSPLDPLGWGENHEMGHNLQVNLLDIYGRKSSEVSNNIFPLNINRIYALDNNEDSYLYHDYMETTFNIINNAYVNGVNPSENHPLWFNTSTYGGMFERLLFYEQLMFASRDYDLYTKMYITERLVKEYKKDENIWIENRDALGFSDYSLSEIKAITSNDFIAILASRVADKDLSQFIEGFGVSVSSKAKLQIDSFSLSEPPLLEGVYFIELDDFNHRSVLLPDESLFIPLGNESEYISPTN